MNDFSDEITILDASLRAIDPFSLVHILIHVYLLSHWNVNDYTHRSR